MQIIYQLGSLSFYTGCYPFTIFWVWQVAIFLVLAMVLRRKPDVLINLLPKLSENLKYQGQDKLPVLIWMIVQVSFYIIIESKNALSLFPVIPYSSRSLPFCRQAKQI